MDSTREQSKRIPNSYPFDPATLALFLSLVEKTADGCWQWTGVLNEKGYGRFSHGRKAAAHRASYRHFRGSIPEGMVIDHLCRNRACVNPAHLEVVTNRTNVLRGTGVTAANAAKTHCVHGHEYTPENTYNPPGLNWRRCRTCLSNRVHTKGAKTDG